MRKIRNVRAYLRSGALLAILSVGCVFQLGGCLSRELLVAALADSLALTAATAAQGFLSALLSG